MKKLLPLILMIVLGMGACDSYDSWTTDASARLAFSADTVDFDTLITTVASSTQRFLAYNPNSKGVRIPNVWLQHGADSHFRVNVDGEYLPDGYGADFEIRCNDSIFILAEVKLPDNGTTQITTYTDSLCFQMESGRIQYITLMAEGENAEHHHGIFRINSDSTLQNIQPIVIYDSMYVAPGAKLTLQPGTRLLFQGRGQTGATLGVDGELAVHGTLEKPVIFRGNRMDNMFSYLPYDNTPQQWGGVYLRGAGHTDSLQYLDMHGSNTGLIVDKSTLVMQNCIMYNTAGNALTTKNSHIQATNTQISNSYGDLYKMIGGSALFNHCTLAQYNNFSSSRGYALDMQDFDVEFNDTMFYDIDSLVFNNSIITGYDDDVIHGHLIKYAKQGKETNYIFRNCYISTDSMQQVQDSVEHLHWQNNMFPVKEDSVSYGRIFQKFDDYARIYDFTPDSAARFRGTALPSIAVKYPADRLARQRPADNADPGAYQCQKYANNPTRRRAYNRQTHNRAR